MPTRHTSYKSREFRGERLGSELAAWLNGEKLDEGDSSPEESRQGVLCVIAAIHDLESLAAKHGQPKKWKTEPADVLRQEQLLTMILSQHAFHHGLVWEAGEGLVWTQFGTTATLRVGEVLDLHKAGLLGRIRKCSCNRWFFARFSHQVSHSEKCRRDLYEKTDEYRAHRRKKAREYYWLHKNKNVK